MSRTKVAPDGSVALPVGGEELPLSALTPNERNPRSAWKPEQIEPFKASLDRFGDLGGIVRNLTTDRLVGGHKRVEVFRQSANVSIVKHEQEEDRQGTVAHGYVLVDGNRFAYREVRWEPEIEAAANLAANRWGAEWAWELVSETLQAITDPELQALTGFPAHELSNLLAADWTPREKGELHEDAPEHPHSVKLSPAQHALLQRVKGSLLGDGADPATTDADVIERLCLEFLNER